jgi:hypothetical protein
MKSSDVFVAGGLPKVTYVRREHLNIEKRLRDEFFEGYKIICVTGPTKSGKTVLCKAVLTDDECIWISGGQVTESKDFWEQLVGKLRLPSEETQNVKGSITYGLRTLLSFQSSVEAGTSIKITQSMKSAALQYARELKTAIIVDDFHYMPEAVQKDIVRSAKSEVFEGLRVILIAVPHQAFAAINVAKEMEGRFSQIQIPSWEESELVEIATLGFPELKVKIDVGCANEFALESFGSPLLMQRFCLRTCMAYNILDTQKNKIDLNPSEEKRKEVFSDVAEQFGLPAYQKLLTGPQSRTDRIKRRLRIGGGTADIYECILFAIARTGPLASIPYNDIRSTLQEILVESDMPQKHQITGAIGHMVKIAKEKIEGEPVVDWADDVLYLTDPFLMFYMRWGIRVKVPKDQNAKLQMSDLDRILDSLNLLSSLSIPASPSSSIKRPRDPGK